ncbi:class I SAM-dependent methyltransferase [Vibrio phage VAP7]|uniref:Methyltransferase domain-containing protein n=1 Tax=Vibrio phage VAP7 TaxID=2584487 RepID=A0A4Y5TVG5_9CAUD|nr:class I SAM-dependent methyltransferase [Vibrio phage VAP7]QDB73374.1 methyltransferase domain-containing protein [Vibrio phage VAP7]
MLSTKYYNENAVDLARFYHSLDRSQVVPKEWGLTGANVLDFGCGAGADVLYMLERLASVTCYEPSHLVGSIFHKLHQNKSVLHNRDVLDIYTDYELLYKCLLEKAGTFHYVLCSAVFQHLTMSQQMAAIKLFAIALEPGGIATVSWRTDPYDDGDDRVHYEVDSLWLALYAKRNGFRVTWDHYTTDDRGVGFKTLTLQRR